MLKPERKSFPYRKLNSEKNVAKQDATTDECKSQILRGRSIYKTALLQSISLRSTDIIDILKEQSIW